MAGESTASAWSSAGALSVIVRQRILDYAKRSAVVPALFTTDDTANIRGLVHTVPRMPDLSSSLTDLTEGNEFTPTTITPTKVSITPAIVGMAAEVTDLLEMTAPTSVMDPYFRQMTGAVVEEMEDDLVALFAALNGGTSIGTSGSPATLADVIAGLVALQTNQAVGPIFWIGHPKQAGEIALDVGGFTASQHGAGGAGTVTNRLVDSLGNVGNNGKVGEVAGLPLFVSPRCPAVNSGADRGGAMAVPDAITIARKWSIKQEMERNALGVSTYLVVSSCYGVAETADNWGVPFETDA